MKKGYFFRKNSIITRLFVFSFNSKKGSIETKTEVVFGLFIDDKWS